MRYAIYHIDRGPSTMFVGTREQCLAHHSVRDCDLSARGFVLGELGLVVEHLRLHLPRLIDADSATIRKLHYELTGKRVNDPNALREWLYGPSMDRPDLDNALAVIASQQGKLPEGLLGLLLAEDVAEAA